MDLNFCSEQNLTVLRDELSNARSSIENAISFIDNISHNCIHCKHCNSRTVSEGFSAWVECKCELTGKTYTQYLGSQDSGPLAVYSDECPRLKETVSTDGMISEETLRASLNGIVYEETLGTYFGRAESIGDIVTDESGSQYKYIGRSRVNEEKIFKKI